jgi:hypothetical protein
MMGHRIFHCALSWVVGHELGHIVVTESRLRHQVPPFEDFSNRYLEGHFEQLLSDSRFRDSLGPLNEREQLQVFNNWLTEINCDILGTSLACGYQSEVGPWRGRGEVIGLTKLAIHIGLLSQFLLFQYMDLMGQGQILASRTHPPIDFRMHCVIMWMYGEQAQEATREVTSYVQKVFAEALRQAGGDMRVWDASSQ